MPNLFLNIPVPTSNGVGAAIDVSKMGATKTIIIGGTWKGAVSIQFSNDAAAALWAEVPNGTFQNPGRVTIRLAVRWMRAVMNGSGPANVDVGAPGTGALFVQLGPVPVDISNMASFKTVVAGGALNVEVSEDGNSWSQVFSFQNAGGQSGSVVAQFARCLSGVAWMGGADILEDDETGQPPFPDPAPVFVTIYARPAPTGSDESGDGSLTTPYETLQRAIRDVPHAIPPGFIYTVDITGIGTEVLPANYQFPAIAAPLLQTFPEEFGGLTPAPFAFGSSFNVRAFPRPATIGFNAVAIPLSETSVPASDYTITSDPFSTLVTVTCVTNRPSWAADNLKGKFCLESGWGPGSCAIAGSDATHLFLANFDGRFLSGLDLTIAEPSATLQGEYNVQSANGAIEVLNCPYIAFQGIAFTATDPDGFGPFSIALEYASGPQPVLSLCDLEGAAVSGVSTNFFLFASVLRDKFLFYDAGEFTVQSSLVLNIPFHFIAGTNGNQNVGSVFDGVPALSGGGDFFNLGWRVARCEFKNGFDPNGAIWALNGDVFSCFNVKIDNPAGPGIKVEGAPAQAVLFNVGGTNLDYGVVIEGGGTIRVLDDVTVIGGSLSDMRIGIRAPRTWANFRTVAPINNEYDNTSPAVGDTAVGGPVLAITNTAPISVQTTAAHGLFTGQQVTIAGAAPNTAADGTWKIVVTGVDTFTLTGSDGTASGVYVAGATVVTAEGGTSGARLFQRPELFL